MRILLCFRFSVRTPSCPGYILYGNPAVEVTLYVNCKIYTLNQKKRRNLIDHMLYKSILPIIKSPVSEKGKKKHPSPIPLPLVPEMVRIIGRGGAEEAMRPVCADCERSRFLAPRIFYEILVITFSALVYPPLFTAK